jgi:CheY-like chemotaxis protein
MSKRVLVVEDEVLLALDIAQQLTDCGFDVVGPATSVAKALALIAEGGCDVAVLDVNLGDETAEPIAHGLRARGTPFVVLTGYSSEQLQSGFGGAPVLSKPTSRDVLVAALQQSVSAARDD